MALKLWARFLSLFRSTPSTDQQGLAPATDTEFSAEVVRITRIEPHPNADRLELARFEMAGSGESAYQVVVQRDTLKVGDLAGYFSVDCLLPLSHPDFAFLKARPDGANKEVFRLRAARLRGVFSQGLLVPSEGREWTFGQPLAEAFGVGYCRPEVKEERGPTGPTKKPRVQAIPEYTVNSLKKLPHLFEEGEEVLVTEKIHGTNFRFGWVRRKFLGIPVGWRFFVGSHHVEKGNGKGGYYGKDIWSEAADRMCLREATEDHKGYQFFGELYGKTYSGANIQDLTYSLRTPGLAIFDIRHDGRWLEWADRRRILQETDLPGVPVLHIGEFHHGLRELAEGKSTLDGATQREGVVIEKLYGGRKKAKYVGEGYLTRKVKEEAKEAV